MNPYEEVVDAWKKAGRHYSSRHEAAARLGEKIETALQRYLSAPAGCLRRVDPASADDPATYSAMGATVHVSAGWFNYGLLLTLRTGPNHHPQLPVLVRLWIRPTDGGNAAVKIHEDGQEFGIREDVGEVVEEIYRLVRADVSRTIDDGVDPKAAEIRSLGFKP